MSNYTEKEIYDLLKSMNVPLSYKEVLKSKIPESLDRVITTYMTKFDEFKKRGVGLIISGLQGIGKTSAAIYLAKYIKMQKREDLKPYSCFFIRAFDLREKYRNKKTLDNSNVLVYDHCKNVDFLVLDNLAAEDANPVWPGPRMFAELIVQRYMDAKPTIITTNLTKKELADHFREMSNAIGGNLHFVSIKGEDQRKERAKALAAEFELQEDTKEEV